MSFSSPRFSGPVLSEESFRTRCALVLGFRPEALVGVNLRDLGLGDIELFELDVLLQELGVLLSEQQLESLQTVRDAYRAYVAQVLP